MQVPITRDDDDIQGLDEAAAVHINVQKMNRRFYSLANTSDGAAGLQGAMCSTSKVKPGNLLVYLGDALHALPAGERKRSEPFLYFRGKMEARPKLTDAHIAKKAPSDFAALETEGGSAKATNKQAETKAAVSAVSDVTGEGSAKAASGEAVGPRIEGGLAEASSNQDDTEGSKKAASQFTSQKALDGTEGADTQGCSAEAKSAQAATVGNEATAADAPSEVAGKGIAKEAKDDPDEHGVVDALRVLRYGDEEVLDCAAVHNLIAVGYDTPQEAVQFYQTRYPEAGVERTEGFKARFIKQCSKQKRTTKLDMAKLPASMKF